MNCKPSRNTSALVALFVALAPLAGCSDDAPAPVACRVEFAGDTTETTTLPSSCAAITREADGGSAGAYALTLTASTAQIAFLSITVPLGDDPSPGSFSSDTVSGWSAIAAVQGDSNCMYAAGTASVPPGSLRLSLTSMSPHGTLAATLSVHAPLYTDCGPSDVEQIAFVF